jgi:hypothetical protein
MSSGKINSIKCKQAPGGNSSFAFSYDDTNASVPKATTQKFASNVFTNENCNTTNYKNESIKTFGNKSNLNIFGESTYDQKQSSIKVTAGPGGASNIVLGSDSSNYEEYRRKK